jgi:6-phosphogluconolactonase
MDNVNIYKDSYSACYQVAKDLKELNEDSACIAISGGTTPTVLFHIMNLEFKSSDFSNLKFFWVDERFVEKDSEESNFGNFSRILIDNDIISNNQVFPMYKKHSSDKTIIILNKQIKKQVDYQNDLPSFDLLILGLGDDGHTASLFPNNLEALDSNQVIIKTIHPKSKQERLTLTKNVINNSKRIIFLCVGEAKALMVNQVLVKKNKNLPATYIEGDNSLKWYLDSKAATLI